MYFYMACKLHVYFFHPVQITRVNLCACTVSSAVCFPHSAAYDQGLVEHILYERQQKIPSKFYKTKLSIKAFTIDELEKLVRCYEKLITTVNSELLDFHLAEIVTSNFLQAAY